MRGQALVRIRTERIPVAVYCSQQVFALLAMPPCTAGSGRAESPPLRTGLTEGAVQEWALVRRGIAARDRTNVTEPQSSRLRVRQGSAKGGVTPSRPARAKSMIRARCAPRGASLGE